MNHDKIFCLVGGRRRWMQRSAQYYCSSFEVSSSSLLPKPRSIAAATVTSRRSISTPATQPNKICSFSSTQRGIAKNSFASQRHRKTNWNQSILFFSSDRKKSSATTQINTPVDSSSYIFYNTTKEEKDDANNIDQRIYNKYFQLKTYDSDEFESIFYKVVQPQSTPTATNIATNFTSSAKGAIDTNTNERITIEHLERFIIQQRQQDQYVSAISSTASNNKQLHETNYAKLEAKRVMDILLEHRQDSIMLTTPEPQLTKQEFIQCCNELVSTVNMRKITPIVISMICVGSSVGIVTPAMPFIIENLALSTTEYGVVVSAFGLTKLLGNIPFAILTERHGRKPYMVYSLIGIGVSVFSIGYVSSFEGLYMCRCMTGFGVAALSTAGTLLITDISTPKNRASTYAPVMSGFAAGTALGPVPGGYMIDMFGLTTTFTTVGLSYIGVAALNSYILTETKPPLPSARSSLTSENDSVATKTISGSVRDAVTQWSVLIRDPAIRSVLGMNGLYWIALSGSQMTLLPLLLTGDDGLGYSATQIGQVYMGMSTVQIVGNPVFAKLSDSVGKVPVILAATTCISAAMAILPLIIMNSGTNGNISNGSGGAIVGEIHDWLSTMLAIQPSTTTTVLLTASLGLWSCGSSMLSTAPLAYLTDRVDDESRRAQAIALFRTCGDFGFLIGAMGTGAYADYTGSSVAATMQSSASMLLAGTAWFAVRQYYASNNSDAIMFLSSTPSSYIENDIKRK